MNWYKDVDKWERGMRTAHDFFRLADSRVSLLPHFIPVPPTQHAFVEQHEGVYGPYDGGGKLQDLRRVNGLAFGDLCLIRPIPEATSLAAYLIEMDRHYANQGLEYYPEFDPILVGDQLPEIIPADEMPDYDEREYDDEGPAFLGTEGDFEWDFDPFDDDELDESAARWDLQVQALENGEEERDDPLSAFYRLQDRLERQALLRKLHEVIVGVLNRLYWKGDSDSRHKKWRRYSKSAKARETGSKLRRMKRRRESALAKQRERFYQHMPQLHIVHDEPEVVEEKLVPPDLAHQLEREFLSVA